MSQPSADNQAKAGAPSAAGREANDASTRRPDPSETTKKEANLASATLEQVTRPLANVKTLDVQLFIGISAILVAWLLARRFSRFAVKRKLLQPLTGTRLNLLVTTGMMLMLGWLILRRVLLALSLPFSTGALLVGLLLLVSIPLLARDVLAGLTLGLRGQLAPGMRLKMHAHDGYIERVGLSSVTLLGDDGGRIVLPTRQLRQNPYELRAADRIARLSFGAHLKPDLSQSQHDQLIEKIRWICLVCPYRQPSSPITIQLQEDEPRSSSATRVQISLQISSEQASSLARSFIQQHLDRLDEVH